MKILELLTAGMECAWPRHESDNLGSLNMQIVNRLIRFLILTMTLTLGAPFGASSAEAQTPPIGDNLIVNGDFQNDISGWSEESHDDLGSNWSSWDANENSNSGSFWGKARGGFEALADRHTKGTVGWQCVEVPPGRWFHLAADFRGFTSDSIIRNGVLYLQDITGEPCPTSNYTSLELPPGTLEYLLRSAPPEPESSVPWSSHSDTFLLPAGVTKLRVGLHVREGKFSGLVGLGYDTTMRFDNIVLGELRPDISVDMSVSDTQLDVGEEFDIDLALSSQYNGFDAEIRVLHDDRLELVGSTCDEGSVIDAQQGADHYFQWFGISGSANPYSRSCTITARAKPGFDDVFTLFAQGWCNDCGDDIDILDNVASVDLAFLPAPDVGVQEVSLSEFPQPGEEMTLDIAFHNHGTSLATSNVSIGIVPMPVFHPTDTGNCAGFAFLVARSVG
jgi:hypothetical protein